MKRNDSCRKRNITITFIQANTCIYISRLNVHVAAMKKPIVQLFEVVLLQVRLNSLKWFCCKWVCNVQNYVCVCVWMKPVWLLTDCIWMFVSVEKSLLTDV